MTKKKNFHTNRHIYVFLTPTKNIQAWETPPAIQNSLNMIFFLGGGEHFGLPGSGAGSGDPFESGSNPDPKHCKNVVLTTCS